MDYNFAHGWYLASSPIITADWKAASGNKWTVPGGGWRRQDFVYWTTGGEYLHSSVRRCRPTSRGRHVDSAASGSVALPEVKKADLRAQTVDAASANLAGREGPSVFCNLHRVFVTRQRRSRNGAARQQFSNQSQDSKDQQDCKPDGQHASNEYTHSTTLALVQKWCLYALVPS